MDPKISLVVAIRDPEYGGNLLYRTQVFVNGFINLANKYRLACELVIVEWNPRAGSIRFREALSWTEPLGLATIRFIEVPAETHRRFPNADRMPIFEYIAKNVGIRRARGEYVLATNPDLLYNSELIFFLASGELSDGCFYRIDRSDVATKVPLEISIEQQLTFCSENVARIHQFFGSVDVSRGTSSYGTAQAILQRYRMMREYQRYRRNPAYRGCPGRVILPADGLHRNASGDFFLMSRRLWHTLRGYTELFTHSHIDSLMCWTAASAGLKQMILRSPLCLYHQDHDRSLHSSLPQTDWRPWYERYLESLRSKQPLIVNSEHWGLADEEFQEWGICSEASRPEETRNCLADNGPM